MHALVHVSIDRMQTSSWLISGGNRGTYQVLWSIVHFFVPLKPLQKMSCFICGKYFVFQTIPNLDSSLPWLRKLCSKPTAFPHDMAQPVVSDCEDLYMEYLTRATETQPPAATDCDGSPSKRPSSISMSAEPQHNTGNSDCVIHPPSGWGS